MQHVNGVLQHYSWGHPTAIAELLGIEPDGRPQAELWFGTHAGGPGTLDDGRTLESLVGPLPYLLKVLAAGDPLSLQVHPSREQAQAGFDREDAAGIPLHAPQRNYRDRMHKPELMYALTPFEAVCGIAPLGETDALLASLGEPAASLRSILAHGGIDAAIGLLLHDRPDITSLVAAASGHPDPRCRWLATAAAMYPGDSSAAILLLLNYVQMQPGDAIFLGAGNMHAYLQGVGIEVMASSDNVLRCGLTVKNVDVDEVLRILDDTPLIDPLVHPVVALDGGVEYPVPVDDFRITRYDIDGSVGWIADGPELIFCLDGTVGDLSRGQCAAALDGEHVHLTGTATVLRVGGRSPA
ncbi:MAG: mannose-6-phosphate isomerase [Ilumatobacteraceae bacterium]|nr:mannose-6-phosphate isomerase [Ilumatobacteraceae bacterium]